jgi:hypothetical protein
MIPSFLAIAWDKLPRAIRWMILGGIIIFYTPIKIREEMIHFIDQRVYAVITPLNDKRDMEITQIQKDINEIKQDTREIKNHLIRGK